MSKEVIEAVTVTTEAAKTMPLINLICIFIGIAALIIIIGWVVKKFGLQIGGDKLKAKDYEYDLNCQTIMYHLQENIEQIDYETRRNMRNETAFYNYHISKLETVDSMCPPVRKSLFYAFKEPFFECINNNHFTRELMPGNYEYYRASILNALKASYQNLLIEYGNDACDKDNIPSWDSVQVDFHQLVDEWLVMAQCEVIKSCKRKIALYEKETKNVSESKHWKEVLEDCIKKNQNYIKELSARVGKTQC